MKRLIISCVCLAILLSLCIGLSLPIDASETGMSIDLEVYMAQCLLGTAYDPNSDAVEQANKIYEYYLGDNVHSPTKSFLDSVYADDDLMASYNQWRLYSLGAEPSSAFDLVATKEQYYESLVVALYTQSTVYNNKFAEVLQDDVIKSSNNMIKTLCEFEGVDNAIELMDTFDITAPDAYSSIKDCIKDSFPEDTAANVCDIIGLALEYGADIVDVVDRLSLYGKMVELDTETKIWLSNMYEACDGSTYPTLKSALFNLKEASTDYAGVALADIKTAGFTLAKWTAKTTLELGANYLTSLCPLTAVLSAGLKLGKTLCDLCFDTSDICEQLYLLECIYDVQDVAKTVVQDTKTGFLNSGSKEDAVEFIYAVECYFEAIINTDIDCMIEFLGKLYNGGILKGAIKCIYGVSNDYQNAVNVLEDLRVVRQNNYSLMKKYCLVAVAANYPNVFEENFASEEVIPITGISFLLNRQLPSGYPAGYADMLVGEFANISAICVPLDTTQKAYFTTSDNPAVISVDNNIMTAVSAGTANITITSLENRNISYTAQITVGEIINEFEEYDDQFATGSIKIGDCIRLGTYSGESIIWRCVDIDENGPLMLCDQVLCEKEYDAAGQDSAFHSDGWSNSVRSKLGSNCWSDSNIRQWLNSYDTVIYTHCAPSYASEKGFLSNFTPKELTLVKNVTQKSYLNEWEYHRSGYVDGGSKEASHINYISKLNGSTEKYWYQNVTDMFFLLERTQIYSIYENSPDYLYADNMYFTRYVGNNGACYERVFRIGNEDYIATDYACTKLGIRPAFYLNTKYLCEENYEMKSNYWELDADTASFVSLEDDLYIDLCGYNMSGTIITNGFSIYGMDSSTDEYACSNMGSFSCVDEKGDPIVPVQYYKSDISGSSKQYMAVKTEEGYTFHRIYLGINKASIRPRDTGFGYKAYFYGDEIVCDQLDSLGFKLNLDGFETEVVKYINASKVESGREYSLLLKNYNIELYGETNVNAQVFLTLKDGDEIESSIVSYSLMTMLQKVCQNLEQFTEEQISLLREMCTPYMEVMCTWGVDAIFKVDESVPIADFLYTVNNGEATITQYIGMDSVLDIPEYIDGYPVTCIGDYAFSWCDWLTEVTIPKGVTDIGEYSFYGCGNLNMVNLPEGLTSIGGNAFSFCYSINAITIPESVINIGAYAFRSCNSLTTLTIPGGIAGIEHNTFNSCSNLTTVSISEGVGYIGFNAFIMCSALTDIVIPEGLTEIDDGAFSFCSSLRSVSIPDGLTRIGDSAFHWCSSLTSVSIPATVETIGHLAFASCNELSCITVDPSNPNYCAEDGVLFNKDKTTLFLVTGAISGTYTVPDGVTWIAEHAFSWKSGITSIIIPSSVNCIGNGAFENCLDLAEIVVDLDNPQYCTVDGVLFDKDKTTLIIAPCAISGLYTIPQGVKYIDYYAFQGCTRLTDVVIPEGVTTIAGYAFSGCVCLKSIILPEGLMGIEGYAFSSCESLSSIIIPEGVTYIGSGAFENCLSLVEIEIPEGVECIENYTFSSCESLTSITIPESVTAISNFAFDNCLSLVDITIPESVVTIGDFAFRSCNGLTSITIPAGVTSIGYFAFQGCSSLSSVLINEGILSIGDYAFSQCVSLCSVVIPEGMTEIARSTFEQCCNLISIYIPSSVTIISPFAFSECAQLQTVYYQGTQEQKEMMDIYPGSDSLVNAAWFYEATSLPTES